jgi:prepilin-type N-terminal cleavage/methylation domain-containing protein
MKIKNKKLKIKNFEPAAGGHRIFNILYLIFNFKQRKPRGFTLLEMLISTGIFAVVIITAVGAMVSLNQAQVKASNIQNIQDNLRFTLEFMTKEIRTGTNFTVFGCSSSGCTEIRFTRQQGDNIGYCISAGAILRFVPPVVCSSGSAITSSAVTVNKLFFNIIGHTIGPSDGQPRITVTVEARSVNPTLRLETDFDLQTTVTARARDS